MTASSQGPTQYPYRRIWRAICTPIDSIISARVTLARRMSGAVRRRLLQDPADRAECRNRGEARPSWPFRLPYFTRAKPGPCGNAALKAIEAGTGAIGSAGVNGDICARSGDPWLRSRAHKIRESALLQRSSRSLKADVVFWPRAASTLA
jgi:hypothetical protein